MFLNVIPLTRYDHVSQNILSFTQQNTAKIQMEPGQKQWDFLWFLLFFMNYVWILRN